MTSNCGNVVTLDVVMDAVVAVGVDVTVVVVVDVDKIRGLRSVGNVV